MKVLVPFRAQISAGGVLTASADAPGQALFWELVGLDPVTGAEGAPYGTLRWHYTRANPSGFATNIYLAPSDPVLAGRVDRVKVSHA